MASHCQYGPSCRYVNTSNGCKYFHPELVRGNVSATVKNNTEDLEKDSLDVEHERCLFGLSGM